jgi:hypothetical protein
MTVLRELIAKLGFEVNGAQFRTADGLVARLKGTVGDVDSRVDRARRGFLGLGRSAAQGGAGVQALGGSLAGVQGALARLGLGFGFGAVVRQMVKLASDANETDNVLDQVFGAQGAARVKDWADSTSKEIGRSKFTLRDYAGQLGAMLEPMTGSAAKAQGMSQDLAKLSVDLASFFNTADDDALAALKSGISGEIEPLRRYGIVMIDATLQEYARTQGIHKKITAMTVAEKTELRYHYIMAKTTKAQGDAARTATGFANASRALKDNLKDLGTTTGQRLLPVAGKLISWGNDAIRIFKEVAERSNIVESVLATLAGGFVALNAAAIAGLIVPLGLVLLIAGAVDEIKTMMDGGTTVLGEWLDKWQGVGTTNKLVHDLKDGMADFAKAVPDMKAAWEVFKGAVDDTAKRLERMIELLGLVPVKTLALITGYASVTGQTKDRATGATITAGEYYARPLIDSSRAAGRGLLAPLASMSEETAQDRADRERNILGDAQRRKQVRDDADRAAGLYPNAPLRPEFRGPGDLPGFVRALDQSYGVLRMPDADPDQVLPGRATVRAPASSAAPAPSVSQVSVTQGDIHIHVGGGAGAKDAARAAKQAAKLERRVTLDAVKRGG